ncbi:MAG: tRNA (adenosine(37)-N6)-dimethylallyltransferase MiaA [Dehalococcoidia bacterium]
MAASVNRLVAVVGPTAAGKTALALALARRFDGEIVGADSRQVYRHMDVGTAKPSQQERELVRHHLIDVADPDEEFSLGRFLDLAQAALADIWSRRKRPFLVGGTGQYVWALLEGWRVPKVPPRPQLRRRLEERAAREGNDALYEELRRIDPQAAQIDRRNLRRVIRALEVYEATGRPLSFWRTREPPRFKTLVLGLSLPRRELYRRIDERVEAMVSRGLVAEVERLLALGYGRELPAMSGIGYREACQHLAGEIDLAAAARRIETETHRLARHQSNWFKRGDPRIRWIEAGEGTTEEAGRLVGEFLGLPQAVSV